MNRNLSYKSSFLIVTQHYILHCLCGRNPDVIWPVLRLVRCVISEPRHVLQYVHDGVSNVSHLPTVNYRVQRWIKVYKSHWQKKKSFQSDTRTTEFSGDQTDQKRQITNPKHEKDVKNTDCRFNDGSKISHLVILGFLLYLQGLNLIPVPSYA